jgi:hypothetical protein
LSAYLAAAAIGSSTIFSIAVVHQLKYLGRLNIS